MTDQGNLYSDGQLYDMVMGGCATGERLSFFLRQVARYGESVLELASGSGNIAIPLKANGVDITGLDISKEMIDLAEEKASALGVKVPFVQGDVRDFDLGRQFRLILFPGNSMQHLLRRADVEQCLACVQQHLSPDGRFIVVVFKPSLVLLSRDANQRYWVGEYDIPGSNERMLVTSQVSYDSVTQINHIRYYYLNQASREEKILSFQMRQFFPQEMEALLAYNGFSVEQWYGDYNESSFGETSPSQIIVCNNKN